MAIRRAVACWVGAAGSLVATSVSATVASQGAYGEVELSGFVRVQADIRTGERNPNNLRSEREEGTRLRLFRQWLLTDLSWKTPIPNLKLYNRSRLWFDTTSLAGDHPNFDAFPTEFDGDEWLLRAEAEDFDGDEADLAFEAWELWLDYAAGDVWARVGRQTIVWGDVAPARLLDDINPLDLSWHVLFEPLGKEVFDHLRVPIWAGRAAYTLPFARDYQIEGYYAPSFTFLSTQLPAVESPFSVICLGESASPPPGCLPNIINLKDNIELWRGASWGTRLVGMYGPVTFTLNFISRPSADGAVQVTECRTSFQGPTPCNQLFDLAEQTQGLPPPFNEPPPGTEVDLRLQHPRFETVGFSLSYFEQFTNVVTRIEFTWDVDRPYEDLETLPPEGRFREGREKSSIIRRDQFSYVVTLDRPSFLIRRDRTALIIFQFEQRFRENGKGSIGLVGAPVDFNDEIFTLLFTQPFNNPINRRRDEVVFDLGFLASTDESYAIVPLMRFEPGNHWRFNLWYNLFLGPEDRPITTTTSGRFGFVDWADGINTSVSYQF